MCAVQAINPEAETVDIPALLQRADVYAGLLTQLDITEARVFWADRNRHVSRTLAGGVEFRQNKAVDKCIFKFETAFRDYRPAEQQRRSCDSASRQKYFR